MQSLQIASTLAALSISAVATITRGEPGEAAAFGASIAAGFDIDKDNIGDLVVANPRDTTSHRGTIYVFSPATGKELRRIAAPPGINRFGTNTAVIRSSDQEAAGIAAVGYQDNGQPCIAKYICATEHIIERALTDVPAGSRLDVTAIEDSNKDGVQDLLLYYWRQDAVPKGDATKARVLVISGSTLETLTASNVTRSPSTLSSTPALALLGSGVSGDVPPTFAILAGSDIVIATSRAPTSQCIVPLPLPHGHSKAGGSILSAAVYSVAVLKSGLRRIVACSSANSYGLDSSSRLCVLEFNGTDCKAAEVKAAELSGVVRQLIPIADLDRDGSVDFAMSVEAAGINQEMWVEIRSAATLETLRRFSSQSHIAPFVGYRICRLDDCNGDGIADIAASRFSPSSVAAACQEVLVLSGADLHQVGAITYSAQYCDDCASCDNSSGWRSTLQH